MKNSKVIGATLLILLALSSLGFTVADSETSFEAPPVEWSKTYGEGGASSATQTVDGGYAIAGGGLAIGAGDSMAGTMLVKTDSSGELQWKKAYGTESGAWGAYSVIQTKDLGYAFSGYRGWLVKTDSEGNMKWSKLFEVENSIMLRAEDGGFVLVGDLITHSGEVALLKTDENGNLLWNKTYGEDLSWLISAAETNDGGFAVTGNFGGVWFAKIDSNGNLQFKKNYDVSFIGETIDTIGGDIAGTSDGGYLITGCTRKSSYYVPWLIKIDSQGTKQWIQKYENGAYFNSAVQLEDGGYLAIGNYYGLSSNDPLAFLLRTDSSGNVLWETSYGVDGINEATLVVAHSGEFVVAGTLDSNFWLAKFGPESKVPRTTYEPPLIDWKQSYKGYDVSAAIQTAEGGYALAGEDAIYSFRGPGGYVPLLIKTNSKGEFEWNRTYGKDNGLEGSFNSITQAQDGGYVLSGSGWLLKTDAEGNVEWIRTYEGIGLISAIRTTDRGFALVGITDAKYPNSSDTVLIRTDENGNPQWNKTFSSGRPYSVDVWAHDLTVASDKGYAIVGTWGRTDFWFAKADANGELQANLTYSAITSEGAFLNSISETSDGGFILAGTDGYNRHRAWIVKTDSQGNPKWNYHHENLQSGGTFESAAQTQDGGYIAGGSELVKVDASGKMMWTAPYLVSFVMINRDRRIVIGYVQEAYMGNSIWLIQFAVESAPQPVTSPFDETLSTILIVAVVVMVAVVGVGLSVYFWKRNTNRSKLSSNEVL